MKRGIDVAGAVIVPDRWNCAYVYDVSVDILTQITELLFVTNAYVYVFMLLLHLIDSSLTFLAVSFFLSHLQFRNTV